MIKNIVISILTMWIYLQYATFDSILQRDVIVVLGIAAIFITLLEIESEKQEKARKRKKSLRKAVGNQVGDMSENSSQKHYNKEKKKSKAY